MVVLSGPAAAAPPPHVLQDEDAAAAPAYPTVVLQARGNMQKFDNCVLLTRVGGFYELYFEQADEYGPLLNLKVAQKKTNAGAVSMAGFPFFQLDRFLKILVQDLNRHVAIAEEFPNDASEKVKSGGLLHDRKVARIVTPGTLIDENFMDPYANNYVMAIHLPGVELSNDAGAGAAPGSQKAHHHELDDVHPDGDESSAQIGLAWLDLSTGYFYTQPTTLSALPSVLSRVAPREIVLDEVLESHRNHEILSILTDEKHLLTYSPPGELLQLSHWEPMLEAEIPPATAGSFTDNEVKAGGLLLHYVKDRLRGLSMKLQPPVRHESMQVMNIDKNSMRSLEIKQTIRDNVFRGSLLHAVRRTVTKGGARLLNEWLSSPSTSLEVINFRQELVARFIQNPDLRDAIIVLLRRSHDCQRLVQRFALNRGDPDDLLRLASTIRASNDIVALLSSSLPSPSKTKAKAKAKAKANGEAPASTIPSEEDCLSTMINRISLKQPLKLAQRIQDAIDEEGLVHQHELEDSQAGEMIALAQSVVKTEGTEDDGLLLPKGATAKAAAVAGTSTTKRKSASIRDYYGEDNEVWIMKPGASPDLTRLHSELAHHFQEKVQLTETLRARLNAASLTLKWTPGLGHICHVKGKDARRSPEETNDAAAATTEAAAAEAMAFKTLSSSRTTRAFHHPEWTILGERLDKVRFQIRAEEQRVFAALREQVVRNLVKLRRNASVLDELDIATSFARLAVEQGLTRPTLNNTQQTVIVGGRHPTVEGGLAEQGRTFQRNDCLVGAPGHGRLWLITGPNMAGKSTFLRQNALTTILAQIGCYVPADYAELGIVDAIFSRVGSADNLYHDQSTFMVEMLETAAILRQATQRSFVIMDEIGRGTTPEDGAAVAFASLHHLVHVNKCRGLFATHFHAVADLVSEQRMRLEDGGAAGAVEMYCTDVEEDEHGGFVYVHKLRKGTNRKSHALKVARLAGLPESAIRIAQQVLESSEGVESRGSGQQALESAGIV
ncbi:muts domain V-domain-containing protein [Podospora appendiculata]|uniref:Muts domain V-domain-containing protein n=1 Tax=Podospora appendiculata TaxID=314037 RepID=A0AAE0XL28_9PEZI|nr:muts domain V-domain-containing protein [Podospora appendiculata]